MEFEGGDGPRRLRRTVNVYVPAGTVANVNDSPTGSGHDATIEPVTSSRIALSAAPDS
jgi:hypothetical protein